VHLWGGSNSQKTKRQQRVKSLLTCEETIKAIKVKTCRTEKMTKDKWVALRQKDKSKKMSTEEWKDLKGTTTSTILLCHAIAPLLDVI